MKAALVILAALCWSGVTFAESTVAAPTPNVLLIAVDDLRPELGCYGAEHIDSPNIDALAGSGRLFRRAYCQQAVCNPSRTSLMTGMRPDSIGVTGNHRHFRDQHPEVVTLPQHFKRHGYHSAAIGKIYHGVFPEGSSITKWDTMGDPPSWSVPAIRFGPRYYYTEDGIAAAKQVFEKVYRPVDPNPDAWTKKLVFGPATESPDVSDNTLYDGKVADAAVDALRRYSENETPFFLAVGFIKPHSPYIAPKKYFDRYGEVSLAPGGQLPEASPSFAGHRSAELRRYTDQPKQGRIPESNQRRVRQAYYACVSFIDAQIGRVLAELDRGGLRDNTIVVLYGDHGYHLGEQGLWGKTTNFELDTRVPLILRVPGMNAPGTSSSSLVELVDLYPTLAELCGLPMLDQLDGQSFANTLSDPNHSTKPFAISQYPRGGTMGYSLRTATHRLTRWIDPSTGDSRATELYDYSDGLIESKNIAAEAPQLVDRLATQLTALVQPRDAAAEVENADAAGAVGFEATSAGAFQRLETAIGTWTVEKGRALIDDKHAKSGRQCLQLAGGDTTRVTLDLKEHFSGGGEMSFWAERWTRRNPFSFRIEKGVGDEWSEVFGGDQQVRVGRAFLSHVKVPLGDDEIRRLRFTVVSPPNTGVLIDDLRIAPAKPQTIVQARVVPTTQPVLVGKSNSPVTKVAVHTSGSLNAHRLTRLRARLTPDTNRSHCRSFDLYQSDGSSMNRLATVDADAVEDGVLTFDVTSPSPLAEGENTFWITCTLDEKADVDSRLGILAEDVSFSNQQTIALEAEPTIQRLGVALRSGGQDGVHTHRIPGLVTTNAGTLIAVYDARRRGGGDLPGDIDVGMSRSIDGGRTWQPMKVIMDMGDDPDWKYDGIGDPAILVDQNTGMIWVAATWSHGNRSWFGSGPGLQPEQTGQLMLVRSDDDGVTWSDPINITRQVKRPQWCFLLQGPGKGITMRDGTLVFAAQYQDPPEQKRLPHSTILYSKDHGETWHVGTGAFDDTTEAQVVEVEPGVLMLNCRYNRKSTRVVMTTRDLGKTWDKHPTSERSLIEPRTCMASLIDVDQETRQDLGGLLLFSNPDSTRARERILIKTSFDKGLTWPKQNRLLLDDGKGLGYSCLTMIDSKTVGILYEGSQSQLTFQRIPLAHLNTAAPKRPPSPFSGLPGVFGDHMVLQAGAEIPVWGAAQPDQTVTVQLGEETRRVRTDDSGKWMTRFSKRPPSFEPIELVVNADGFQRRFTDVLIGDVWLCAGQSNMEWRLDQSADGAKELRRLEQEPEETPGLRLLHLRGGARGSSGEYNQSHLDRLTPESYCEGSWSRATPEIARDFSAVAWYFGRRWQANRKIPVGLICPAVGGTPTEAWIPRAALESDPELRAMVAGNWLDNDQLGDFCRTRGEQNLLPAIQAGEAVPRDDLGPNHSFKPGFMWKAAVEPLVPYAIRGVAWYQGESNAETRRRVLQHGRLFPLLIRQWRSHFEQPLPFGFVQLPALERDQWPWFREQQRRLLGQLDQTAMAVTIDTGHRTNVHPVEKRSVGARLADSLHQLVEGARPNAASGPLYSTAARKGRFLDVSFSGGALRSSNAAPLRHFEVSGPDGVFHRAEAELVDKHTVRVHSLRTEDPVHVRYAWKPFPDPPVNLVDDSGMPASPFSSEPDELLWTSTAVKSEQPDSRPNILLIVSEDNGPELGCYGDPFAKTPNLDKLAGEGVRFQTAYVTQSVCSPSRSTIFTGLYPHQNGQLGLATHQFEMFRAWPTTYSILKSAGYRTGLLGKTHVNPPEVIEDHVDFRQITNSNFAKKNLAAYSRHAGDFFTDSDQPFFLTVNFPDAHWPVQNQVEGRPKTVTGVDTVKSLPFIGMDNDRLRGHVTGYYNCLARLDECVGELLDSLQQSGRADNTLVIYIGDHGAQFARGKVFVTEAGLRIPFLVRWPGKAKRGWVSNQMVSTVDLLPTIVGAAGATVPPGLPGRDLRAAIGGSTEPIREHLFGERNSDSADLHFPQRAVRDDRYKLIKTLLLDREDPGAHKCLINGASNFRGSPTYTEIAFANKRAQKAYETWILPPEYQLYDLKNDPHEFVDLAEDPRLADVKQRLIDRLDRWQQETNDPLRDPDNLARLTEEIERCVEQKRRSPAGGWKYVDYFAPKPPTGIVYQQRPIPSGTPLEGRAENETLYGYRIPSLLVTRRGSLLAFCERRLGLKDHAQNDIVLKRSTDGGLNWSDEQLVFEDGMASINDPLTVQLESGRILLMFSRFPYGRHTLDSGWIRMADLGYGDPNNNVMTMLCHSDDDGETWSRPVDISRAVKPASFVNANTPGAMIQISRGRYKGRIVTGLWGAVPVQAGNKRTRKFEIVVAYSDDDGKTWLRTPPLKDISGKGFANECQVAEADDGALVLISRNQGGDRFRKKAFSDDGGQTWTAVDIDPTLPSVACMGSIIKGPEQEDGSWKLYASFPSDKGRKDGRIARSDDGGKSWHIAHVIPGPFAYSALQLSADQTELLCHYESDNYKTQTLLAIPLSQLDHTPEGHASTGSRNRK